MPLWLFILLLKVLNVLAGSTQKPCTERLDIPSTQSCCRLPELVFSAFEKKCGHLDIALHNWPCTFDCIYKAANILNGTHLSLDKVNDMLNKMMMDHQKLKDLFVEGFAKCQTKEEEMVKTLKRRRFADKAKCSPLAMLYGVCAYKHVFLYCPEENWTNSSMCNRIRKCEVSKSI